VIDAGRTAAREPSSQEQRERLLNTARDHFDFVLIDTPSFPTAADALSWVDLADLVISVVRVQHTPRKLAASHLSRLSAFARALAVVINEAGPAPRERAVYPAPVKTSGNGKERPADDHRSTLPGVGEAPLHPDPQVVVHSLLEVLDGANRGNNRPTPVPAPVEVTPKRSKGQT
jgi:Mrp family chromosome partitioning ATPase